MTDQVTANWSVANRDFLMAMVNIVKARLMHGNLPTNLENEAFLEEVKQLQGSVSNWENPPAIEKLSAAFGLSQFERDILVLCAGVELDASLAELVASVNGDPAQVLPTFGLSLVALHDAHWSALSPDAPLRYWRLLEVGRSPLITRAPLKIDEHVLHYLAGVRTFPERLLELMELQTDRKEIVSSQQVQMERLVQSFGARQNQSSIPFIHLAGNAHADKITLSIHVCSRLGFEMYLMQASLMPADLKEAEILSRLWTREAVLNDLALYLDCADLDLNDRPKMQALTLLIKNVQGLIILGSSQWGPQLDRERLVAYIEKPGQAEQLSLWKNISGNHGRPEKMKIDEVVSQFNLSAATIHAIGTELLTPVNGIDETEPTAEHLGKKLWKLCSHYTRPNFDELAERIVPVATWDDIVLPDEQRNTLRAVTSQIRLRSKVYNDWGFASKSSRGLGISLCLAGESGTGKTMAAEIIAHELDLELYKIDLSKVVNKYIGETEKNLKRIFDAAEDGGAILLFDEADVLFGRRSEIKDSHDRYSNLEIGYLLQRMESYRGLSILTTNMKNAIDNAFLRRIRFVVQFPFPDATSRALIWQKVFPAATPRVIDVERLARLNVSGGIIRNIALNAAFQAAAEGADVSMVHISQAAKIEYGKLEKPYSHIEV